MSYTACTHLGTVSDAVNNYHVVLAYYVTCIAEGASKRKAIDAHCSVCQSTNRRTHACLECAFFGCFDQENELNSHMKDHALRNEHNFAININHGYLFCFECKDYIYDEDFENIYNDYKLEARKIDGNQFYMPWKPKIREIAAMKDKIKKISDNSYIGLRGIVNIGNTCYTSVIIQMFMHNPVLRDFFLSDKHKCFLIDSCLMCEMFVLYQEFYSGISIPYDPTRLILEVIPKYCNLELGSQHDAHELFQAFLIGLHASCQDAKKTGYCNCMIHRMFFGINQSIIKCVDCEASSFAAPEYFIDIPLDIDEEINSLIELVKRKFSKPQPLSCHRCSTCKEDGKTLLYQTIKKLPTIICFHMNCFEVKTNKSNQKANQREKTNKKSSIKKSESKERADKPLKFDKKSTAFVFEEWIDMSECLNSNANHSANSYTIENKYCLFAVICHKSKDVGSGHYLAYVRQRRDQWYECDDNLIFKKSLKEVLKCEPTFLFYYKQP